MTTSTPTRPVSLESAVEEVEQILARAFASTLAPAVRSTVMASVHFWTGNSSPTSVRVCEVCVSWDGPDDEPLAISWFDDDAPGLVLWAERALLYRVMGDEDREFADERLAHEAATVE